MFKYVLATEIIFVVKVTFYFCRKNKTKQNKTKQNKTKQKNYNNTEPLAPKQKLFHYRRKKSHLQNAETTPNSVSLIRHC